MERFFEIKRRKGEPLLTTLNNEAQKLNKEGWEVVQVIHLTAVSHGNVFSLLERTIPTEITSVLLLCKRAPP